MMKKITTKFLSLALLFCIILGGLVACGPEPSGSTTTTTQTVEEIDYAGQLKLDWTSESVKQEVTVRNYVDGDTTHFFIDKSVSDTGVLKARYLAVDTPESTGKIEPWGKKAATFTKSKLLNATSIVVESDTDKWNLDSTGARHLVWVWYKTSENSEYRNLNIEILQNGLAVASKSAQNRYGETCMAAIAQARALKLNVYSGQKDPDYYDGDAIELTLKELRSNIEEYNGMVVAFEGVVIKDNSQTVYVEYFDEETNMYYGMTVYYGFGASGDLLDIISVGNKVRIVGTVSYYETGGTYQVSGLTCDIMRPTAPNNTQLVSSGHKAAYLPTTADTFLNGKVSIVTEEGETVYDYAALAMNTSISMSGMKVKRIYTTTTPGSDSYGAMTLTCEVDGLTVDVRTVVLRDANGQVITAAMFEGKTIDVKGLVDYYDGDYQIKVFSVNDITIH